MRIYFVGCISDDWTNGKGSLKTLSARFQAAFGFGARDGKYPPCRISIPARAVGIQSETCAWSWRPRLPRP